MFCTFYSELGLELVKQLSEAWLYKFQKKRDSKPRLSFVPSLVTTKHSSAMFLFHTVSFRDLDLR